MTHNIKEIRVKDNLIVEAVFFCGVVKDFDVSLLFEKYPEYKVLKEDNTLWQNAELLPQGSGVYINDEMDLTAEEIWKYGKTVGKVPVEPNTPAQTPSSVMWRKQGNNVFSIVNISFLC